ncbi:hypothetical protein T4A_7237 [Trichinella pseudospiralis]|uniref:Uncharacterized protein n=1 Tax=Trichinella pseudospiralis TaxID=6337 RepID=A0A0V1EWY5_TRIPS|nr:hypothetical protein T4A_7237 [Trichinella pseudospiralis]
MVRFLTLDFKLLPECSAVRVSSDFFYFWKESELHIIHYQGIATVEKNEENYQQIGNEYAAAESSQGRCCSFKGRIFKR